MSRWTRLMAFGARAGCHQLPERSFFYHGYQFPVCARCTGCVLGFVLALGLFFLWRPPLPLAVACCGVMFLDWLVQRLRLRESTNPRRLLTGVLGGYGITSLYCYGFRAVFLVLFRISG